MSVWILLQSGINIQIQLPLSGTAEWLHLFYHMKTQCSPQVHIFRGREGVWLAIYKWARKQYCNTIFHNNVNFETNIKETCLRCSLCRNNLPFCFASLPIWTARAHLWSQSYAFRCTPESSNSVNSIAVVPSQCTKRSQYVTHRDPKTAWSPTHLKWWHFFSMNCHTQCYCLLLGKQCDIFSLFFTQ